MHQQNPKPSNWGTYFRDEYRQLLRQKILTAVFILCIIGPLVAVVETAAEVAVSFILAAIAPDSGFLLDFTNSLIISQSIHASLWVLLIFAIAALRADGKDCSQQHLRLDGIKYMQMLCWIGIGSVIIEAVLLGSAICAALPMLEIWIIAYYAFAVTVSVATLVFALHTMGVMKLSAQTHTPVTSSTFRCCAILLFVTSAVTLPAGWLACGVLAGSIRCVVLILLGILAHQYHRKMKLLDKVYHIHHANRFQPSGSTPEIYEDFGIEFGNYVPVWESK